MRETIDQALTIFGVILIVVPVALMTEGWAPLLAVFAGLSLVGMGVWRLGTRLLPDRRVYVGLRAEVDGFIGLVRRLNERALAGDSDGVARVRDEMEASVERMQELAGQVGGEV